ncbi:MAG: hypothetical protein RLY78_4272 [Pseudomonadota bacterium]
MAPDGRATNAPSAPRSPASMRPGHMAPDGPAFDKGLNVEIQALQ